MFVTSLHLLLTLFSTLSPPSLTAGVILDDGDIDVERLSVMVAIIAGKRGVISSEATSSLFG